MTIAAYAEPTLLSTHADQSLLYRNTAALRTLRLMQAWAAEHIVEPGRGLVWIAQSWLQSKIGVSRSQYFRVLARLQSAGWISPSIVPDESGRDRPGFTVAIASASGFATKMRPSCDQDATQLRPRCDFPTSKLNGNDHIEGKALMSRDTRQSTLPGVQIEQMLQQIQAPTKTTTTGKNQRDPRIRVIAARVDDYERERYRHHPRCVRPKRDTPQARDISVEAITRAIERVVESKLYDSLNIIEMRLRAVVELNWDAADRKAETWEWWTGSAMWAPNSLERVLGWLDEKRNWVYLERAAGRSVLPMRTPDADTIAPDTDISSLSPAEQQKAYDQAHGIHVESEVRTYDPSKLKLTIGGREIQGIASGESIGLWTEPPAANDAWSTSPGSLEVDVIWPPVLVDSTDSEREAAEQLSAAIDRGDAPDLSRLVDEMAAQFGLPPQKSDEELRAESKRKAAYVRSTTPEQRSEDAKAGRKPWETE